MSIKEAVKWLWKFPKICLYSDENGITKLSNPFSEKPLDDKPYIRCVNRNEFPYRCAYDTGIETLSYDAWDYNLQRTDLYTQALLEQQAAVSQAVAQNWYVELAVYRGGYTVLGIVNENGVPCEEILRQVL